jgi:hypothetical protein
MLRWKFSFLDSFPKFFDVHEPIELPRSLVLQIDFGGRSAFPLFCDAL